MRLLLWHISYDPDLGLTVLTLAIAKRFLYNYTIMNELLSVTHKAVSAAHIAIWRFGIFFFLGVFFVIAAIPGDRTTGRFLDLIFFGPYIILEILHIVSVYRNPQPTQLGISDPKRAFLAFSLFAIIMVGTWLAFSWQRLSEWPWLLLAIGATIAAYTLRPRPCHCKTIPV